MAAKALADCCGCGHKAEDIKEGNNDNLGKFTGTAKTWADLYIEGNTPATTSKLVAEGGVIALAAKYGTDLTQGVTNDSIHDRHEQFGENRNPEPPFESWWAIFFECFKDMILIILIIAAIVSLAVGIYEHGGSTGWIDGVAILIAVIIVATVTASNDYNKQLQFRRLSKESEAGVMLRAIREGREMAIPVEQVVVGDILQIDTGARLPADAILLTGSDFKTNESALTGESDEVAKIPALTGAVAGADIRAAVEAFTNIEARVKAAQDAAEAAVTRGASADEVATLKNAAHELEKHSPKHGPDSVLLGGTTVTSGTGRILAVAVGTRSLQGKIMAATASESGDTPLQEKLDSLATKIGYVGMAAAVATFIAMMIIKATGGGTSAYVTWASWTITTFIYAITIIVVAIPEGLPLAVTISLAYSTGKMLAEKNLIRHLEACETMGNATDICTDKTGTLTENLMTVVETWLGGAHHVLQTADSSYSFDMASLPAQLADLLKQQLSLNSTAAVSYKLEPNGVKEEVKGSKTEGAGLKLVNLMQGFRAPTPQQVKDKSAPTMPYEAIRASAIDAGRVLKQLAFSSERKMMSTIVRQTDGSTIIYTTGGSDFVLARCVAQLRAGAGGAFSAVALSDADKTDITANVITSMAKKSLRTIAVAFRSFPAGVPVPAELLEHPEQDLTLYCILGIKDPLRRGVKDAVEKCTIAGVRVRMVTGDNKITARAIAEECGILRTERDLVLEGPVFRSLSPKELDMVLPRLRVLARSSPNDKMILVRRLNGNLPKTKEEWTKEHGQKGLTWDEHRDITLPGYYDEWLESRRVKGGIARCVVGVTGDGTNDAPALKYSDVGLAMGIAGTEVAKEACDIIITDDNFASIVNSIKWGRSVYDNVRSFLQFQLTVNIVALLLTFISAVMQEDPPLNPVMMLWVNLIMDTMGALALATQTPSDELLNRRPYSANAFLVSPKMWRHLLIQSFFQLITLLILLKVFPSSANLSVAWLNEQGKYLTTGGATGADISYYTNTFLFNIFVFSQIFNEFNARSLDDRSNVFRGLGKDLTFLLIIVVSAGVQALLVEFGSTFVKCTGLTPLHWLYSLLIALITVPLGIVMRLVPVNDRSADYAHHYIDAWETTQIAAYDAEVARRAGEPHPAFSSGKSGKVRVAIDPSAPAAGLPLTAAEAAEVAARGLDEKSVSVSGHRGLGISLSTRNLGAEPVLGNPMSPTNDLPLVREDPATSSAASPAGDAGFVPRFPNLGGAGSGAGTASAAVTSGSHGTATPVGIELGVVGGSDSLAAATGLVDGVSGAGAMPPPSPVLSGAQAEVQPFINVSVNKE